MGKKILTEKIDRPIKSCQSRVQTLI